MRLAINRRPSSEVMHRLIGSLLAPIALDQVDREWAALGDEPSEEKLDLFAVGLLYAWMARRSKQEQTPESGWAERFHRVGFVHNMLRREEMRPTEPVVLYRAATHERARGLSWTDSLEFARAYREHRARETEHDVEVWRVVADPSWLLAFGTDSAGDEFVVDVPPDAPVETVEEVSP